MTLRFQTERAECLLVTAATGGTMRTPTVVICLVTDVTDVLLEPFETASLGFGGALSISLAQRLGMQSLLDEMVRHFSPSLARPSTPDSQWTSGVQELESRPPCPLRECSTHRPRLRVLTDNGGAAPV